MRRDTTDIFIGGKIRCRFLERQKVGRRFSAFPFVAAAFASCAFFGSRQGLGQTKFRSACAAVFFRVSFLVLWRNKQWKIVEKG